MTGDTLPELSDTVQRISDIYAERFQINRDPAWYLAKLTEELGELVAADLKCNGQARSNGKSEEDIRQDREQEAADLFAHLLLFCRNRNIDLASALKNKWYKHLD